MKGLPYTGTITDGGNTLLYGAGPGRNMWGSAYYVIVIITLLLD